MDQYTIICKTYMFKRDDRALIEDLIKRENDRIGLLSEDDITDDDRDFSSAKIFVQYGKIIIKDIQRNSIGNIVDRIKSIGINIPPSDYIGKKTVTPGDIDVIKTNIEREGYYIHSNHDICEGDSITMFNKPIVFNSSYGILRGDTLILFAKSLHSIEQMLISIYNGCSDIREYDKEMIILKI